MIYYSELCIHLQTDGVKCTSTQTQTVTCQVGYPALKKDEEVSTREEIHFSTVNTNLFVWLVIVSNAKHHVILLQMKFQINFDYNFEQLQNQAVVKFEAKRYAELIRNLNL